MTRAIFLLYGLICYALFQFTFLYLIGFVGNFFVPISIDGPPTTPLGTALLIDAALLILFALQHSGMARPAFKKWWTKIVPEPIERSTYVLFTCICLLLMMFYWEPLGGVVWEVKSGAGSAILITLSMIGWLTVLASSFLINHFDLFGLRQVWFYFKKKPYEPLKFRTPILYKYVRHPLYLGLLAAFWFTPLMTATHLFFALINTAYVLYAITLEERDMIRVFGKTYTDYISRVPMLLPFTRKRKGSSAMEPTLQGEPSV